MKVCCNQQNEILWDLEWMRFFLWNILNMSIMLAK